MATDLTQEFAKSGTGFPTGTTCQDTSLYKCTDNRVEYIEHIAAGDLFPPFPGGKGTSKTTWYRVTKAADGDRTSFTSVKVVAGAA